MVEKTTLYYHHGSMKITYNRYVRIQAPQDNFPVRILLQESEITICLDFMRKN
jgi:hypothetical protein